MRLSTLSKTAAFAIAAATTTALSAPVSGQSLPMAQAAPQEQRAVSFAASVPADRGVLVLPLARADELATRAPALSEAERDAVTRALGSAAFEYGARERLSLRGIGDWAHILVIGLGEEMRGSNYETVGAVVGRALLEEANAVTIMTNGLSGDAVASLATGFGLGEYRSDLYRARENGAQRGGVTFVTDAEARAQALYDNRGRAMVAAMAWTRDISNEPGNAVYPQVFVDRARAAFAGTPGVTIDVLDENRMRELGMGAILGVGRGSERPPRMMVVRYRGSGAPAGGPIVLVGKGVTFDTGGISIKPSTNMENMRMDMSGAASVTGAVLALARSQAPVNVVAVAPLAENMPDGRAIRPGDVLTAMNGKTIQVINTDAEGRLLLADAFSWVERNLTPAAVVDLATLTGAVGRALSNDYAGLFSRHEPLAEQLQTAGETVGEPLWRLPMHESYAQDMSSTVADIRNTSTGRGAGAGTAAHFLGEFISRDIPWAHLDIANMAWSGANDWKPDGSAGFGVRLLDHFVRNFQPVEGGE
ncbi:leucyl aminopeptidase [Parasphingopyxis sp.]|uniref:leucyl aminopeptidase n=1 Tax=Parasphingopyxis sp. TaxID=1920299 RepID=UPI00260A42AF|nr:leucyl aminopeptidase [Parasphingopyxis sp.]